ncbi:MAG: aminoglycoside phosphotransferase family protein [Microlunatus sp.]
MGDRSEPGSRREPVGELDLQDPGVPGAAVIADGTALSELLAEAGEDLLDRNYLRYKPGTSLVAGLRLASGPAFAYAVSAEARPKLAKLIERAPEAAVLVHSTTTLLLVARPAADRDLPALAKSERLSAAVGRPVASWTTLAYKPQRRWVGRPGGEARPPELVLRSYRPRDLPATMVGWRLAGQLGQAEVGARLPDVRTVSARRGLAAVSWLPGTPLDRLLDTGSLDADHSVVGPSAAGLSDSGGEPVTSSRVVLAEVGIALAELHQALPPRPAETRPDARALRSVLSELSALVPALRDRASALLRTLDTLAPRPTGCHPIHGDFSADQVIVGADGRIGVTDWDRAGWGDPGADLGSLRAAGMSEPAYAAVLEGYAQVRAVPASAQWHGVAAAVQRLTEPLRQSRVDWRSEIAARLAQAERQLGELASNSDRRCV